MTNVTCPTVLFCPLKVFFFPPTSQPEAPCFITFSKICLVNSITTWQLELFFWNMWQIYKVTLGKHENFPWFQPWFSLFNIENIHENIMLLQRAKYRLGGVIVTTRIISCLVGDSYKPSFATLLGRGTTQSIGMPYFWGIFAMAGLVERPQTHGYFKVWGSQMLSDQEGLQISPTTSR